MQREADASPIAVARLAAEAARATRGVVDLDGGAVGEFATYGGGHRIRGVRVRVDDRFHVTLRIVAALGPRLEELADAVREAVSSRLGELGEATAHPRVDIAIVDIRTTDEEGEQ